MLFLIRPIRISAFLLVWYGSTPSSASLSPLFWMMLDTCARTECIRLVRKCVVDHLRYCSRKSSTHTLGIFVTAFDHNSENWQLSSIRNVCVCVCYCWVSSHSTAQHSKHTQWVAYADWAVKQRKSKNKRWVINKIQEKDAHAHKSSDNRVR